MKLSNKDNELIADILYTALRDTASVEEITELYELILTEMEKDQ